MTSEKWMWIVAGPPGAGKTALCGRLFHAWIGTTQHVDADDPTGFEDADDLPPGLHKRIIPVSKRLEIAESGDRNFVVETRLVSRKPLSTALRLRHRGWGIAMIYLALPRLDLYRERIQARVSRGGADVKDTLLERGFQASLDNLPRYIDAASRWLILDSSGARQPVIARGSHAAALRIQPDATRALLPQYPLLPATNSVREDGWAEPALAAFVRTARWHAALDQLIGVAQDMESREIP